MRHAFETVRRHSRIAFISIACEIAISPLSSAQVLYTVEELGTLNGGPVNEGYDISAEDHVVGRAMDWSLVNYAALWANDMLTNLGGASTVAQARGISQNAVYIAGSIGGAARVWTNGSPTPLPWLNGHIGAQAWDVNSSGLVIGWSINNVGDPTAARWVGGAITPLDVNHSWAFAVNDSGQIIGRRDIATGREARLWFGGTGVTLPDLNGSASATGITPRGIITGGACQKISPGTCAPRSVVWLGESHDISILQDFPGALEQNAWAANDRGPIVGSIAFDFGGEAMQGIIWPQPSAAPILLSTLVDPREGWLIQSANSINHRGLIAGFGVKQGQSGRRAIILHPVNFADITNDAVVDIDDLLEVINNWGACDEAMPCPADLTGDGNVDVDDLLAAINNWG